MTEADNPRRRFLRLGGLGATVAALAGTFSGASDAAEIVNPYSGRVPRQWDAHYDLVIVGAGGAGLCAAAEAAQRGVKLLVIEKQPFLGGISANALGYLYGAETTLQKQQNINGASLDAWWVKLQDGTGWSEPLKRVRDNSLNSPVYYGITKRHPGLFRDITSRYHELIDFMLKYGAQFNPMSQAAPFTMVVKLGYLPVMFRNVIADVRQHGGTIVSRTGANKIYLDDQFRVAGIRATDASGKPINIKTRALLMASGGFLNNDALIQRYMPYWSGDRAIPSAYLFSNGGLFLGQETGDGIVMGLEINASVDDMDAGFKYKMAPKNRGDAFVDGIALSQSPIIFVTPEGKRVSDDSLNYTVVTLALIRSGAKYGYFVFDDAAMDTAGAKNFRFADLVASGAIFKADTLREAAGKAGVDPDGLQATVDRFNKDFDEHGNDSVFGKKGPLFQKISKPPFYVSDKHYPVRFKTEGGLETDDHTRVLDHRTVRPIVGFYAAGATNGSCTAALGDSMQCGRMAAGYVAEDLRAGKV